MQVVVVELERSSIGGADRVGDGIALDAMGGDNAPGEIVAGALTARDELGIDVVLVGRRDELGDVGGLDIIDGGLGDDVEIQSIAAQQPVFIF